MGDMTVKQKSMWYGFTFPIWEKSYLRFTQIFRLKLQEMLDILWRNYHDKKTSYQINCCIYGFTFFRSFCDWRNRRHFKLQENRGRCWLGTWNSGGNAGKFPAKFPETEKMTDPGNVTGSSLRIQYFSSWLDENRGYYFNRYFKDCGHDTTQAIEYASEVWEKKSEQGFLENYRYWRCSSNGEVRIIFLDCRRQLDNFLKFFAYNVWCFKYWSFICVYFNGLFICPYCKAILW